MRPLIVITGSGVPGRADYKPELRDTATIPAASEAIGRELALQGFDLVVFSSSADYIEKDVVKGYLGAFEAVHPGSVVAHTPFDTDVDFGTPKHLEHVLKVSPDPAKEWEISYYQALFKADGVVLLGGGRSTRIAGVMALAKKLPVVAVACFGGSALTVWQNFNRHQNDATKDELDLMGKPWREESAAPLVKSLQSQLTRREESLRAEERQEKSARRSRTVRALVAAFSLVLALLSIALQFTVTSMPFAVTGLLAGPLVAAVGGALVHDFFTEKTQNFAQSVAQGAFAGAVAALLYVVSQRLTAATPLDIEAVRSLSWLVVVIGLMAGFTVDLVLARMRNVDVLSDQPLKVN